MNEKFTKEKNDKQAREITGNSPAAARLGARARAFAHALPGACLSLLLMILFVGNAWGQSILLVRNGNNGIKKYDNSALGTVSGTTYTPPAGYRITKIECWGAGAGGEYDGGMGGGGGAYARVVVNNIPVGTGVTVSIGAGGAAGTSGNGNHPGANGGSTTVSYNNNSYKVTAEGGHCQGNGDQWGWGQGGRSGDSWFTGWTKDASYAGGNGGDDAILETGGFGVVRHRVGGGGGGAAGSSGVGKHGKAGNVENGAGGGNTSDYGGAGGKGGVYYLWNSNDSDADPGSNYGGGGGGGIQNNEAKPGKGADGCVRITISPVTVNITFNANMPQNDVNMNAAIPENTTIQYGSAFGNKLNWVNDYYRTSYRKGYTFSGWNTAANGTGTSVTSTTTSNFTSDITLYAQWSPKSMNVTFNLNGGSWASGHNNSTTQYSVHYGSTYRSQMSSFDWTDPVRSGYVFMGWNTNNDGSGLFFGPDALVSMTTNHTLYAYWVQEENLPSAVTVCYDGTVQLCAPSNYSGYTWTPATGLSSTTGKCVTLTAANVANSPTTYTCTYAKGNIANYDFSQGNVGFSSDYEIVEDNPNLTNELQPERALCVTDCWGHVHNNLDQDCVLESYEGDKANGGKFLAVNGGAVANAVVYEQTVAVTRNTNYDLSVQCANAAPSGEVQTSTTRLMFFVNGVKVSTDTMYVNSHDWHEMSATWNSGNNDFATIQIRDFTTSTQGNDFALDHILFEAQTGPSSGSHQVAVTVNTPVAGTTTIGGTTTICYGGEGTTLTASTTGNTGTMTYAWDNGLGNGSEKTVNPTQTTTYHVTATATNVLNGVSCTATEEVSVTVTVNKPSVALADMSAITVCAGEAINLNAVTSGTTVGTPSFSWTGPDNYTATGQTQTISNATTAMAGIYTVTASASNTVNGVTCTSTPVSKQVTVTVNAPDAGTPVITGSSTICSGTSTTLNVSTSGETGTMSYSWDHDLGTGTSKSVTPEGTTTYHVTATATVGSCTNTKTAEFTLNVNTPNAGTTTIGGTTTICYGGEGTTLTASTTGNTGDMTYTWDHELGNGVSKAVNPTATTTYNVATLATNVVNGVTCTAAGSAQVTVTVNTPDAGTTTIGDVTICSGTSTTLTASTTGNDGTMSYTWDNDLGTGASQTVNPATTTTYHVTATATKTVNGVTCTAEGSAEVTVTVNTPVAGTTTIGDVTICSGTSTTLTASTTGNDGTMTYTWDNDLGAGVSQTVNPETTTTYHVTATATKEVNGVTCTAEGNAQVTVTVNTPDAGTTTIGDVTICSGTSTALTASTTGNDGTMTYTWDNDLGTGASQTVNPETTTTYHVTATATKEVNGVTCTAEGNAQVTVTVNTPDAGTTTIGDVTICSGTSTTLTASTTGNDGTMSYTWDNDLGTGASQTVNPATTTTYHVTATATKEVNGVTCTAEGNAQVTVTVNTPDAGTTTIGDVTICRGTSTALTASTTGNDGTMTYTWDNDLGAGVSQTVNPETTTTYNVTATATKTVNGVSCTATEEVSVTVTVNTPVAGTTTIGDVTICSGTSIALTASTTGNDGTMTYAWDNDLGTGASKTVNPETTTTYHVTATATKTVNGVPCTATEEVSVTVTVNTPAVTLQNINPITVCAGSPINLSVSPSGTPTGTLSYSWTGPNDFTSSDEAPSIASVTPSNAGDYTVVVTATNVVNGVTCTTTDTKTVNVTVNDPNVGTPEITGTSPICNGKSSELTVSTTGNTGEMTYVWSNDLGNGTNKTVSPTSNTTYSVTATATVGTCFVTASVSYTVNVNELPTLTVTPVAVLCNGGTTGKLNVTVGGTAPDYKIYLGGMEGELKATLNTAGSTDIENLTAGTYTVAVEDGNGCQTTSDPKTITEPTALTAAVTGSTNVVCYNNNDGTISYTVGGGTPSYTVNFTLSGETTPAATATQTAAGTYTQTALAPGIYTVSVVDANGCPLTAGTATLTEPQELTASFVNTNVDCHGNPTGSITVNASGGTAPYLYANGTGAFSSINIFDGLTSGTYNIKVKDAHNCAFNQDVTLSQPANALSATAAVTPVTCNGAGNGSIVITATGGTTPYQYKLNSGDFQPSNTFSPLAPATYVVTVQDANGCEYPITNITVSQPDVLTIVPGDITPVRCNGEGNGKFTFTLTGGNTISDVTVTNGIATFTPTLSEGVYTVSGLDGGTYTVSVMDNKGCSTTKDFVVDEPDELVIEQIITTKESCDPANDGTAEVVVSGGNGGYTYVWSGEDGQYSSSGQNPKAEHLHSQRPGYSGGYQVVVTDAKGCQADDGFDIELNNVLAMQPITCPNCITVCSGNEFVVAPTEGIIPNETKYTWGTPSVDACITGGLANNDPSPVISGTLYSDCSGSSIATYSVTPRYGVCVGNPQAMAITVEVNVNPGITVTIPNAMTKKSCDPSFTIPASFTNNLTAFTTTWKRRVGTDETTETVVATHTHAANDTCSLTVDLDDNTCAGTYYYFVEYTGTNAIGCTAASDACVVTVNAGTWSIPDPGQESVECVAAATPLELDLTANPVVLDNRFPTVTDGCGRTITDIQFVSKEVQAVNTCESKVTYTYKYTACDGTTNNWTYIYNVKDLTAPTIASDVITTKLADINQEECEFKVPNLVEIVRAKSSDNCITNSDHLIITQVPTAGTVITAATNVEVTVKDSCNNSTTTTINVTVPTLPVASITTENTTHVDCFGNNNGSAKVTVTNGTADYGFLWSDGQIGQTATGLVANTYTVTVTDANGCKSNASVTITQPDKFELASTPATTPVDCYGNSNGTATIALQGGTTNYSITLNGVTKTGSDASYTFDGLAAGTYSATIVDAHGCSITDVSVTITQPVVLAVALTSKTDALCNGDANGSINITVTGGNGNNTYSWSNNTSLEDPAGLAAGDYSVTITDAKGCSVTGGPYTIGQPAKLVINAVHPTNITCYNGANGVISITDADVSGGTSPYTYTLKKGETTMSSFTGLTAGEYTVIVTDDHGCSDNKTVTLTQPDALHIVTCPGNVTENTDAGQNYATVELPVPTFAPADNNAHISNIANKTADDHYPVGTTAITYTITNDCGETVTCSFNVIVADNQDPVITCAVTEDQTVIPNTTGNIYTHSGTGWNATATDNVGVTSLTYSLSGATSAVVGGNTSLDGQTFNYGTTTVTWTAKDAANHSVTCSFNVIVEDNTPPTITCAVTADQNVTVNTENDIYTHSGTAWNATATDNVGVTSLTYSLTGATVLADAAANTTLAGQTFNIGETTVTWTAKDAVGNSSDCSFKVIVKSNLTITANSHEWTYDGTDHTDPGFVVTTTTHTSNITGTSGTALTLPNGDLLTTTITGTIHDVGTEDNEVGTVTIMRDGVDVTSYYSIVKHDGLLEVKKKHLKVTVTDQTYVYNNAPQGEDNATYTSSADIAAKVTVEGLEGSDALTSITLNGRETAVGVYNNKIVASAAAVGGNTGNYDIEYVAGKLTITKATLTIDLDTTKVYDGTVFVSTLSNAGNGQNNGYQISGLQNGAKASGVVTSAAKDVAVYTGNGTTGTSTITTPFTTTDGISNYNVTYNFRQEITKAPLTINLDTTKVYDGTVFVSTLSNAGNGQHNGYTISGLQNGAKASGVVTSAAKDVAVYTGNGTTGTSTITTPFTTTDGISNYNVTYNFRQEITKATLTINLDTTKVYDGTVFVSTLSNAGNGQNNGYQISGLQNGAKASGVVTSAAKDVAVYTGNGTTGTSTITTPFTTTDGISNYNVTYNFKQEITKATLTIDLDTTKVYDGLVFVSTLSNAGNGQNNGYQISGLQNGAKASGVVTSAAKDVAVYTGNGTTGTSTITTPFTTTDGIGNYNVTYNFKQEITKATLTITLDTTKVYDGLVFVSTLSNAGNGQNNGYQISGLQNGAKASGVVTSAAKDVAVYTGNGTTGTSTITTPFTTTDGIDNYNVTYNFKQEITKKNLTISLDSSKVYDGTPLVVTCAQLHYNGLVSGDVFTTGTITTDGFQVGDYYCNDNNFTRMWADLTATQNGFGPENVRKNYSPTFQVVLRITARPLTLTAASDTKVYDGTPLTNNTFAVNTTLGDGDAVSATVNGSQTCLGENTNVIDATTVQVMHDNGDGSFTDVTSSYSPVTLNTGLLKVTPVTSGFSCPADITITLLDGTTDTLVAQSLLGNPSHALITAGHAHAVNNLASFNPMSENVYTITWKLLDDCDSAMLTCTQNVTVEYAPCEGTITMANGTYNYKRIGSQCWFTENLKEEVGEHHAYNDVASNVDKFGYLYTWYTAVGVPEGTTTATPTFHTADNGTQYVQGICPAGWAVGSTDDFHTLEMYAGSMSQLKDWSTEYWQSGYEGDNPGTGFNARGGGWYNSALHRYEDIKTGYHFWKADAPGIEAFTSTSTVISCLISYYCDTILEETSNKTDMRSVRCIRKNVHP